ncbi:hypothetical protein QBA75_38195 [Streptomyces stelliscabiei]
MIGKSWGTAPSANGVAATGVEGLKTIVPSGAHLLLVRLLRRQGCPVLPRSAPDWLSFAGQSNEASRALCGRRTGQLIDRGPAQR